MHPGTKDAAHQKYNSITYASQSAALLLVMLLVELQNTRKKRLNRKKDPIYAIFLKRWGFKDVKYDIPIQLGPRSFNFSPQCKKSLYNIISGEIPEN